MSKTSPPNGPPPQKKARTTKHPFGNPFYARLTKFLLGSKEEAIEGIKKCCEEIADYKKAHPEESLCDSGDEIGDATNNRSNTQTKKMFAGTSQERLRLKQLEVIPERSLKKTPMSRSVGSLPEPKDESSRSAENSDDSDSETLTINERSERKCVSCSISKFSPYDQLLQCHTCKEHMHMKCNKPEITKEQSKDPRFHFICSECLANEVEKRSAPDNSKSESLKVQKMPPMPTPASRVPVDFNQKLAEFKAKKNLLGNNSKSATILLKK
ncbi:unnamed protein product, partial [Mesorhabditis belari]|uniref:Zinc finger PHD-type domain-containing protein n=1 Tax=Mesorhabditis belari TaxID=2138241 RepID=A0AAF3E9D5_9BILA